MMKFTPDHEWLKIDGDIATVGITKRGSEQLGDLVYIQLPDIGASFSRGDEIIVVESVKAATDVCCPLDGQIAAINHAIVDDPALVREDPQGKAWFFKLKLDNPATAHDLLDETAYTSLTA